MRIGMILPEQYRQFLLEFNGGTPTPDTVNVEGLPGGSADVLLRLRDPTEKPKSCEFPIRFRFAA
jgi:hypothetical protein